MKYSLPIIILFTLFCAQWSIGVEKPDSQSKHIHAINGNDIISVVNSNGFTWQSYVYDQEVFHRRCDTVANIRFWRHVMKTGKDTIILNHAASRRILDVLDAGIWSKLTDDEKDDYRLILRERYCLSEEDRIFATTGKKEFYQFRHVMPNIDRAIRIFQNEGVDPWYAQSILLIESPVALRRSPDGALGHFQLMEKVARNFGLEVNGTVDERINFDKSAMAASRLLDSICIPYAVAMLDERQIAFHQDDLWFRLLVLHVYHAGAGNVKSALNVLDPKEGGMDLIYQLWKTESRGFRNASQNYSQIALASILELNDIIFTDCVIDHYTRSVY